MKAKVPLVAECHDFLPSTTASKLAGRELVQTSTHLFAYLHGASNDMGGMKGVVQRFYLALCHKCNECVLLWEGLYASEIEGDDFLGSLTGDLVRVSACPSLILEFDSTKCSDSIALVPNPGEPSSVANGSSVIQRASKVWGAVLSSTHFSPKTEIHSWAIRRDKCERGHVFVGVATSQASMRTYVDIDKYGWGVIGTQALWHDRRKVREPNIFFKLSIDTSDIAPSLHR